MTVVERGPAWLRRGGGIFLMVIAVVLALVGALGSTWGLYLASLAFFTGAVWWSFLARISVTVDDDRIELRGPLWKRTLHREGVRDVVVEDDTGMNPGMINWPVTLHEGGSLVRMTMGGSAAVGFVGDGRRYRVVLADRPSAERLAEAITG
ncbi:hypothetical protein AC792_13035 [Arthrobacter sp. RIT-PI-e]|uniref:hypothetical protein n=1 Tax=Arthrobacter sp. RIT-PI-e TaxID=1681197 RepID=UPI00067690B0|nr:hypothetical protein [Arthrobacter sp. RIT-PI-e]KNC17773.1 hypothetical protein AC792_13035 [Arthrobacter sp. RIT-PI-e]